ncbi:MAG TPA: fused response regulator/phosphatase [Pseudonocardiaceae bacterium]|nr:fused response regulator/phosphatase [Pseudonocardiaceae bacterium]
MSSPAVQGFEPARILVVDDNEASRYITASWLRRGGHVVTEVATGQGALAIVDERQIDVVMLDVHLPDMSGYEVCERIKGDPRTAALPVIHISATSIEPQDRARGLSGGADGYLIEPVDPALLLATVEATLRYYRARAMAERLARRLTSLTRATLTINSTRDLRSLSRSAAEGTARILETTATALVPASDGRLHIGRTAGPDGEFELRTEPSELLDRLAMTVLGGGLGARVTQVDDPGWPTDGPVTVVVVRVKAARPPICLMVPASAADTAEDRNLLLQWGNATALAADGLRAFTEEHDLALILQRSLLPSRVPEVPELPIAVRYVPAASNNEIGGDFYEVTELDGRLLIAVGDVTGHSIEAATIMGEVRHAMRAYAVEGHGLVAILDRLDAMLRRFHPLGFTTLCLLLVDLAAGVLTVANAGHPPPLIADRDGSRYLDVGGPLLGVGLDRPAAVAVPFPSGTTVVLVTDGLLEGRYTDLVDSMAILRDMVSHDQDLEELCDLLLDRLGHGQRDDIALLALRRV